MQRILLLFVTLVFCLPSSAQRKIEMRNLYAVPQVHVRFGVYTVSYIVKDINRALQLLTETGDSTFGTVCGLDTTRSYMVELYPGKMQYNSPLQNLLQNGVGAYLLTTGHALIRNKHHKRVWTITANIDPAQEGETSSYTTFFDYKTNDMLFYGKLPLGLYGKDMGIDY